jgi:hypothetical protein
MLYLLRKMSHLYKKRLNQEYDIPVSYRKQLIKWKLMNKNKEKRKETPLEESLNIQYKSQINNSSFS